MSLCRWLQTSTYCFWWIWYTSHATGHWFIGLLVQIKLNSRKCAAVRFSLSSTGEPSYSIENVPISVSQSHRDIGVMVRGDLSWSDHYSHICSRAYCSLYQIRRSFSSVAHISVKKRLYLSVVRSKLSYCSQLWRPHLKKDILLLERVQRRVTKYIG